MKIETAMKYPNARIYCYESMQNKPLIYSNIISLIANNPISDEMEFEISNSKLQLRQLSSLTDEEKIELYYLHDPTIPSGFMNFRLEDRDFQVFYSDIKTQDKLREWDIDIDGLIESGEAEV